MDFRDTFCFCFCPFKTIPHTNIFLLYLHLRYMSKTKILFLPMLSRHHNPFSLLSCDVIEQKKIYMEFYRVHIHTNAWTVIATSATIFRWKMSPLSNHIRRTQRCCTVYRGIPYRLYGNNYIHRNDGEVTKLDVDVGPPGWGYQMFKLADDMNSV